MAKESRERLGNDPRKVLRFAGLWRSGSAERASKKVGGEQVQEEEKGREWMTVPVFSVWHEAP